MWNLVLDELIAALKTLPWIRVICYADDVAVLAWGPDLEENISHVQEAIDLIMHWAEAHFLCLSPKKSEAMIFTRQRKYGTLLDNATQLVVAGKRIAYEPVTVRYLGQEFKLEPSYQD